MSRESTKQDLVNRFLDEISAMKFVFLSPFLKRRIALLFSASLTFLSSYRKEKNTKKTRFFSAKSTFPKLLHQKKLMEKKNGLLQQSKDRTKRSENLGKKNSGKQLPHSRTETSSQLSGFFFLSFCSFDFFFFFSIF